MEKTCDSVWKKCLQIIKDNVSTQTYKTWFTPIKAVKLQEKVLTLEVPSQFFYEWLEENYVSLLRKSITTQLGKESRLEYSIVMEPALAGNEKPYTVTLPTRDKAVKNNPVNIPVTGTSGIRNPFIIPGLKKMNVDSQLNAAYTFEDFIEGDCNRLARSAGYAVSEKPGTTSFNPLLIYGGVGMGKTHLANAIGIQIKNKYPDRTVVYVASEKFGNQFYDAVKNNAVNDFIHFYQMMDVLIIDDIQFFGGKEKTQDVFFHIFNHLHQTGKQLILTSDKAPVDLQGMEQRLLSRFKWGLSADLQMPDLETRVAILEKKIYRDGIKQISKDIIDYIAYSITSNVRELEGALISVLAQATMNKKEITLELAKSIIDKFVRNTTHEISIDYIQKIVCDFFNIKVDMLKSKTRKRQVVQARQITMYFAKHMTKNSLSSIGMNCGGKDHATVLHACRTVTNLLETDKKFKSNVTELQKRIAVPDRG